MSKSLRAALAALILASPCACKPEPVALATPLKIVDVECDAGFLRGLDGAVQKAGLEGVYYETRDLAGGAELTFVSGPSRDVLSSFAGTLPPPGAPAGTVLVYEDQNGRDRPPWRVYCAKSAGLTISRVAELRRSSDSVKLVFEAADAAAFAAFTGERIGRPIAFVVGDEALSVPVVHEQILNGVTFDGARPLEVLK